MAAVGGRVPYGYRLADAGPHPNRADARWGRRLHRLDVDPDTGPIVGWIFESRLGGHSVSRITRALNDVGIAYPSAAEPESNSHRSGAAWTARTVQEIPANPVYTGRMVWNRVQTVRVLVDPDNPGLGERETVRWNSPEEWVISEQVVHPPLVSKVDFVAVQGMRAAREDARHEYALAGLPRCVICDRAFEGHWVHNTAGYRYRHGHTSAHGADPDRPRNSHLPEKAILAKLPLLSTRLTATSPTAAIPGCGTTASGRLVSPSPEEVIGYLRQRGLVLRYDSRTRTLETGNGQPVRVTV